MEQVDMYSKLKNRNLLWFCKQGNFTSGYTSGGLVKDSIASRLSAHPMDAKELTEKSLVKST
jgi:hypothetical protein